MTRIENLEIHVSHACNLNCESCSHYSNHAHHGLLSLEDSDRWMSLWRDRLDPVRFSLLGGEPTIHPRLPDFIPLCRSHWPKAKLQLVTNGFFLHRHPQLPHVIRDDPNITVSLSIHHNSSAYRERLVPIIAMLVNWKREFGIDIELRPSFNNWTKRYHGYGSAMQPFEDRRPRRSWENCNARTCRQLYQEKLWKCPPIAYLSLQDAKFGLSKKWVPYLRYRALDPGCTDEELEAFLGREEEPCCGMCPAEPQSLAMPDPLRRETPTSAQPTPLHSQNQNSLNARKEQQVG